MLRYILGSNFFKVIYIQCRRSWGCSRVP